jgi:hypothetical protein
MSSVNGNVTPGYTFAFDANQRFLITRDRLNLLGAPTVTVNLTGKVNSDGDDVANRTVKATMLADAVADVLITATATVAAESSNNVDVSIQFKDLHGNALALNVGAHIWLTASGSALVPVALPSGGAPTILSSKGFILTAMTASAPGYYLSDSTGLLQLRFTESGTLTKYLALTVQDKLVMGSGALIWT